MMKWCISKEQEFENALLNVWLDSTRNKFIFAELEVYNICKIFVMLANIEKITVLMGLS